MRTRGAADEDTSGGSTLVAWRAVREELARERGEAKMSRRETFVCAGLISELFGRTGGNNGDRGARTIAEA